MVSGLTDVQQTDQGSRLSGRGQQSSRPTLKCCNFPLHSAQCWITQTGIKIAAGFEVKKISQILRRIVLVGCTLDNGYHSGGPVLRVVATLNTTGIYVKILHGRGICLKLRNYE